jgi:hypothetical protein
MQNLRSHFVIFPPLSSSPSQSTSAWCIQCPSLSPCATHTSPLLIFCTVDYWHELTPSAQALARILFAGTWRAAEIAILQRRGASFAQDPGSRPSHMRHPVSHCQRRHQLHKVTRHTTASCVISRNGNEKSIGCSMFHRNETCPADSKVLFYLVCNTLRLASRVSAASFGDTRLVLSSGSCLALHPWPSSLNPSVP